MTEIQKQTLTDGLIRVLVDPAFIKTVTRSLAGIIIVLGMFILLYYGINIPEQGWWAILIGVAATFGIDGVLAFLQQRKT